MGTTVDCKILLVEDDPDFITWCRTILVEKLGCPHLRTVERAEDALTALKDEPFDLVLLDNTLPDHTGQWVLEAMQARGHDCPVLMLTGTGSEAVAVAVMKAGAADYLAKKDLSPERLVQSIGSVRRLHAARRETAAAAAALEHREAEYRRLYETVQDVILVISAAGEIRKANRTSEEFFGARLSGPGGGSLFALMPEDERAATAAILQQRGSGTVIARFFHHSGEVRILDASYGWSPGDESFICIGRDVTAARMREIESRHFLSTINLVAEVIFDLDGNDCILSISTAWTTITGHRVADSVGRPLAEFVHADDRASVASVLADIRTGRKEFIILPFRIIMADAREYWLEGRLLPRPTLTDGVLEVCGVLHDITATYLSEKRLNQLALHDPLTGLPNRILFQDRLDQALHDEVEGGRLAVGFIDIDHFKELNDSLGHKLGDQALAEIAARLRTFIRPGDTLARWGGDEFVVLLRGLENISDARTAGEQLREALREPFLLGGQAIYFTLSIGLAVHPDHARQPELLLGSAESAMYYAKRQGRNLVQTFDDLHLNESTSHRYHLHSKLSRAVRAGLIHAHYQPIVDSLTGTIVAVEVLARWHDDPEGWIPPSQFIALAEDMGLINELGDQLLRESTAQLRLWRQQGWRFVMAVNLSKRQLFSPEFIPQLQACLKTNALEPDDLVLEITESMAMHDVDYISDRLAALAGQRFRISLDDFGVGHASLAQLHSMPVSELKIDISFVRRMVEPGGLRVVQAIVQMAKALGLNLVAEGIETEAAAAPLREMGVHRLQGYHFGRPMPPGDLTQWLHGRQEEMGSPEFVRKMD